MRFERLPDAGAFVQESEQESEGERAGPALDELGERVRWGVWIAPDIRVDALLEDLQLVVEYDGREAHERALRQAADEERTARIRALGYEVIRVRREDLQRAATARRLLVAAVVAQRVRLGR